MALPGEAENSSTFWPMRLLEKSVLKKPKTHIGAWPTLPSSGLSATPCPWLNSVCHPHRPGRCLLILGHRTPLLEGTFHWALSCMCLLCWFQQIAKVSGQAVRRTAWFLLGSLNPLARILRGPGSLISKALSQGPAPELAFLFIGNVTLARWAQPRVTGFQQWAAAAWGSWPSAGLGFVLLWGLGEQRQCFITRSSLLGHHWPGGVSVLILSAQSWH